MHRVALLSMVATGALWLALVGASAGAAAEPALRIGDQGAAVRTWQKRLNIWLRATGGQELPVTGTFGDRTLAATQALEAAAGLHVDGVADDRTRAALEDRIVPVQYRQFEWPVPVPGWFWGWAQWYLHRGPYENDAFRSAESRPATAPQIVPDWSWRRISDLLHRSELVRARAFVRDRLVNRYGAGTIEIRTVVRSRRDTRWIRLSGVYDQPIHRLWAMWLSLGEPFGRWHVEYEGLDAAAVQPEPERVREQIPCDIRPAFAKPRC